MKYILTHYHVEWYVNEVGKLVGIKKDSGVPHYEFWIGNPPAPTDRDYALFVAVCDFAVAQGILRRIPTYAPVK